MINFHNNHCKVTIVKNRGKGYPLAQNLRDMPDIFIRKKGR